MKMKKRSIVLFLCMLLSVVQIVPAFAGSVTKEAVTEEVVTEDAVAEEGAEDEEDAEAELDEDEGGDYDLGDYGIGYYDLTDGCFYGRLASDTYKEIGITDRPVKMSINVVYYEDGGDSPVIVNIGTVNTFIDETNYTFSEMADNLSGGDMTLKEFMDSIEKKAPEYFVVSFWASFNDGDYSNDLGELMYCNVGERYAWGCSSSGQYGTEPSRNDLGEYFLSTSEAELYPGRHYVGIDGISVSDPDDESAVIRFYDPVSGHCISTVSITAERIDYGGGHYDNIFYFSRDYGAMAGVLYDYSGKPVLYVVESSYGCTPIMLDIIYEHTTEPVVSGVKLGKATISWADGAPDFTYDGMPHTPDIKVTVHGTEVSSSEYNVKYFVKGIEVQPDEIINAGKVTIKIVPSEGSLSTGSKTKTYKIKPRNIAAADKGLAPEFTSLVNGGEDVPCDISGTKPEFSISYNGIEELIKGIDYTVKYSGNKKVGEGSLTGKKSPKIIVKGKGNYTGKAIIPFNIVQQDINNLDVRYNDVVNIPAGKDAAKLMNKPVVWSGNKKLKAGRDYTVTYYVSGNALDISRDHNYPDGTEVSMVIEAKKDADGNYVGNFKGSTEIEGTKESEITYFISNKLIKSSMVSIEPGAIYGAGDDEEFISKIKVYEKVGDKKTAIDREYYNVIVIPESVELITRGKNKGKVKVSVFVLGNGTEYGGKIIKTFIVGLDAE